MMMDWCCKRCEEPCALKNGRSACHGDEVLPRCGCQASYCDHEGGRCDRVVYKQDDYCEDCTLTGYAEACAQAS